MVLWNQQTDALTFCIPFSDANRLGSIFLEFSKIWRKHSVRIHTNFLKKLQKSCEIWNFTAFRGGPEGIRTLDLSDANRTLSQLSYKPEYEVVWSRYVRLALPAELQARTFTLYTVFSKMQEGIVLSIAYVEY